MGWSLAKSAGADVRVQLWDGVLAVAHLLPAVPRAGRRRAGGAFLAEQPACLPTMRTSLQSGGPSGVVPHGTMPAADVDDEIARAQAATRLQAITRGRAARKKAPARSRRNVSTVRHQTRRTTRPDVHASHVAYAHASRLQVGPTTVKWSMSAEEKRAFAAATSHEQLHRGNRAAVRRRHPRQDPPHSRTVAPTVAPSPVPTRTAPIPTPAPAPAHPLSPRSVAATYGDAGSDARRSIAARRRVEEAKVVETGGKRVDEERAATRVQAFGRGFKERKARSLERAEQEAAATKLQAARRGQTARVEYQGTVQRRHDEEFKAATLVQTSVRGRQARQTVEHRR